MQNTWILAALIAVMTAIACSSGEDSATTQVAATAAATTAPAGTRQPAATTPDVTKEALVQELAQLQSEVEVLRAEQDRRRADVTTTSPSTKPQPTDPPPAAVVIPTPTGPGICGRSPAIQEAILRTTGSPYCRTITEEELYRIQCFKSSPSHDCGSSSIKWRDHGPKPGDFAGLRNLSYVGIEGPFDIPAGAFTGSSIRTLTLDVDTIQPGAFEDATVQTLRITGNHTLPKGTLPTSVTELKLEIVAPPAALQGNELDGLSKLEFLELGLHAYESDKDFLKAVKILDFWDRSKDFWKPENIIFPVPSDMFVTNTSLKGVQIYARTHLRDAGSHAATVNVDRSAFSNLPQLEELSLRNFQVRDHTSGTSPFMLNPESPLHRHLDSEDGSWNSWNYGESLNVSSPK